MTEREYEAWFNKYLGDVESLDSEDSLNSPFANAPSPVNERRWKRILIVLLISLTLVSAVSSMISSYSQDWLPAWISTISSNFSIGVIASLFLMIYTEKRERNINFYSDVLPLLQKRSESLHTAYFDNIFKIRRYHNQGAYQQCYEAWNATSNACFVILDFLLYLNTVLKYHPNSFTFTEHDIEALQNEILAVHHKVQEEFFNKGTISSETLDKCENALDCGMYGLHTLRNLITELQQKMYQIKYDKKNPDIQSMVYK